ncbi:hypothetical protein ACFU53_31760 [Streptomyces sp. NPDC057474]|uniref:hypothetical protein n=1 Tax=Streptomyces sp. NPDC057474 TaxID=3346144 RepID=UPI003695934D
MSNIFSGGSHDLDLSNGATAVFIDVLMLAVSDLASEDWDFRFAALRLPAVHAHASPLGYASDLCSPLTAVHGRGDALGAYRIEGERRRRNRDTHRCATTGSAPP